MDKGLVCVAVAARDAHSVVSAVQPMLSMVDVVEVRLDAMETPQVRECCDLISLPLLFTCRPDWEGGEFRGSEEERIKPLLEAIELDADFIDCELNTDKTVRNSLLATMKQKKTRMIISSHDFSGTPPEERLQDILQEQMDSGAHIGKIVTVAHHPFDVLRVLNLQVEAAKRDFPLCAFCMGEIGRISRLVTLFFGGFMTYGALNETQATAPGQLSIPKMKQLMEICQEQLGGKLVD